ncbi:transporter substrate-binding domain-containing protein [Kiloniella laminariae]|uniref:Transporter substrate-binding domain-containing protein n=1 Tax=Kiloniella laminariae TaxID=454162 RepID=A0ABT4LJR4_9PROT|nr:transporter substrate-binding domain-containing protein [Kiloniella laminariae]MCZ4281331.1 transporter substrate-binding domain-containing protein [Kiloniella laminariae]
MMKLHVILPFITFLVAGTFSLAQAADQSRLHKILSSGELRVGTTGDWNPMSIKNTSNDSYEGFDIDVVTELAKDMGVDVTFVPTDWKTLINGVVADKYDITTSASLNPKRMAVAGYTDSYYQVGTVPLTLKKNLARFNSWEDINQPDITVATTLGTVQEQQAKEYFPQATLKSVEAPARDFQEVISGRALVHITSNVEAATLIQKYAEMAIVPVAEPRSPTPLAMLVAQEDQVWINYLNHWIELKKSSGFFNDLARKWKLAD